MGPDAACVLSSSNDSMVVNLTNKSTFTIGELKLNKLVLIGATTVPEQTSRPSL